MSAKKRTNTKKKPAPPTDEPCTDVTLAIMCAVAGETHQYVCDSVTPHEQRSIIMQHAKNLDRDGKIALGMILIENNQAHQLKEIHQGVSFLLDNIPDHIVESMYAFVKHRLKI